MSGRQLGIVRPLTTLILMLLCSAALPTAARTHERPRIEVVPQIPHAAVVVAAAYSPDGALVLSGSGDTTLKLWDAATSRLIRTFAGHTAAIADVAFSPDGRLVLSAAGDGTLRLWETATGRPVRTVRAQPVDGRARLVSVAFSPDGARLLSGSNDGMAKLWDAASGQLLQSVQHAETGYSVQTTVAFAPDGARVLTGGGEWRAKLWDAATGRLIQAFGNERRFASSVRVALSPDGARLAVGDEYGLKLWDAATGALIRNLERISSGNKFIAFSENGARIVSCCTTEGGLDLWSPETGERITYDAAPPAPYATLVVSPDRTRILFASANLEAWLEQREATTGKVLHRFARGTSPVLSVAATQDGKRALAADHAGTLTEWSTATGKGRPVSLATAVRRPRPPAARLRPDTVVFSPDGARILSAPEGEIFVKVPNLAKYFPGVLDITLWDTATGNFVRTFEGAAADADVTSIAVSPDGASVVAGRGGGLLTLWDLAADRPLNTFKGHSGRVGALAFSPDGSQIVSGADDGTVRMWNAQAGNKLHTLGPPLSGVLGRLTSLRTPSVKAVAFSPNGALVLSTETLNGEARDAIRLWDAATGQLIRTINTSRQVNLVAFSPDGTRLLSGGTVYPPAEDAPLKLWEAATGRLLRTFEGHFSPDVRSVAFSRDGRRILSGGSDGTLMIWDAESGHLLATLVALRGGKWLATTPEGFFDASDEAPDMVAVVRGLEAFGSERLREVLHRPDLVRAKLAGDPEGKVRAATDELGRKLQLN